MLFGRGRDEHAALLALAMLVAMTAAAFVYPVRPILAIGLVIVFLVLRGRNVIGASVVAAALPVSLALGWAALDPPVSAPGDCTNPLAPFALWRLAEMIAVVGAAAALIWLRQFARAIVLPFVRPTTRLLVGLALAAAAVGAASLVAGPIAAGPFFGSFALELSPLAIAPALVFALSNAIAEEVAYRGVLRGGLVPALGAARANVAQATIFAFAHSGPDFVGSALPVMAAMFVGALIAGEIATRTRSLLVPIALHAAFDIPIFFNWACRPG